MPVVGEDPKAGITNFELEYLALLEAARRHHNELLVPTWNGPARELWETHGKLLSGALKGDRMGFTHVAEQFQTVLNGVFEKVDGGRKALDDKRTSVSKALGAHPALTAKGATRGRGSLPAAACCPGIRLPRSVSAGIGRASRQPSPRAG
jgi:hypothetical protein